MSSNGVPIQDISNTVGHKSTHVTEAVYRHVIVPEIRGGATVMDDVFTTTKTTQTRAMEKPRAFRHFAWHLTFEQKPDKSVRCSRLGLAWANGVWLEGAHRLSGLRPHFPEHAAPVR